MRIKEKIVTWIAWHLPKSIVYWSTIRAGVYATTGEYSDTIVPEISYTEVLQRCHNWS